MNIARYEAWVDLAREHGLQSNMMSRTQIADAFGGHSDDRWIGGVQTPSDAKAEPWQAVPAVARLAQDAGAIIMEDCAVRLLDQQAGRVTGVVTEHGTVRCDQVVVAAGAWSRLFLGAYGVQIPQLSVVASAAQTAPLPDFAQTAFVDNGIALRRRDDGGCTLALADDHGFYVSRDAIKSMLHWLPQARDQWHILRLMTVAPRGFPDAWGTPRKWKAADVTPFERTRVLEPAPLNRAASKLKKRFSARFPGVGTPEIADIWSGMIDAMPDNVPIVGAVPDLPGVTLATGMSGHGFGIGPSFGRAIARQLTGLPDEHDLTRFRFNRFTDGSKLLIGPGL
jgi:glycine/D-amino acid oxidase-like deaminating enzyme